LSIADLHANVAYYAKEKKERNNEASKKRMRNQKCRRGRKYFLCVLEVKQNNFHNMKLAFEDFGMIIMIT
jgi:hypothetical protein